MRAVRSSLVSIPMPDGVVLSGRLWLPELAEGEHVPAILDCNPYRITDMSAIASERAFAYRAAHGYACLRIDLRGSGNSGGLLVDEYLPQEQSDNLVVIEWAASQSWSSGAVGWTGISWSGFAALQIAALRPSALKAIVTVCSTDDRYADDVHYRGGSVLGSDMLPWASTMLMLNALPPDPEVVGDGWREMWAHRLAGTPPAIDAWLQHQTNDDYWKQASVCEDFTAVRVPTLVVGGWADGYVDAVFRLMDGLECPRKAIIGPWGHGSPHAAEPGPAIGFLQEELRWFGHWLKGEPTGVMDEPPFRAWLQDHVPPATSYNARPGAWAGFEWPLPVRQSRSFLVGGGLTESPGSARTAAVPRSLADGLGAGEWCPSGTPGDFPGDQSALNAAWCSYTSPVLTSEVSILGNPMAELSLSSSQPAAEVIVRLCDVASDGSATLVSRGVLNLRHVESHELPKNLVPGETFRASVQLKATSYRFPVGHRISVSLGGAYFPWIWPSPAAFELTLHEGAGSFLTLPVLESGGRPVLFAEPAQNPPPAFEIQDAPELSRELSHDKSTGRSWLTAHGKAPTVRLRDSGIEFGSARTNTFEVRADDPLAARVTCSNSAFRRRRDWQVRVQTHSEMWATETHFVVTTRLQAFESEKLTYDSERRFEFPRQ